MASSRVPPPPAPLFAPSQTSSPSIQDEEFLAVYLKCLKLHDKETFTQFVAQYNLTVDDVRTESQATIWIAALIALTIISSVGLIAVVIVPLLQKINYRFVLQYFVALAIGALSGDSMLHLMPHSLYAAEISKMSCTLALAGVNPGPVEENRYPLYKGIVGISGLLVFFLSQRCFMIVGDLRKKAKEKHSKESSDGHEHHHHKKDTDTAANCMAKDEDETRPLSIESELNKDDRIPDDIALISLRSVGEVREEKGGLRLESCIDQGVPIEKDELGQEFGIKSTSSSSSDDEHEHEHEHEHEADEKKKQGAAPKKHDHSHEEEDGHGHDHSVPTSVKSLMAMVILGDGLHNFVDGIAVGAAFAGGIAGGLSTAVAVFFHELPHELGDFAVLLKSGMTLKMALVFNLASSLLSYLGMTIGVLIGSKDVNEWIYAVVAGMFLYVALVNMLPELTPPKGSTLWKYLIVQLCGILTGNIVMFMIAYYEDDIKKINFGF